MIEIIAVGRKIDPAITSAVNDYQRRLRSPFEVNWVFTPYSKLKDEEARTDESRRILQRLTSDRYVILLDEVGDNISSNELSIKIRAVQSELNRKVTFVVGGAYGVDSLMRQRADFIWSLSNLVLPHRIVHLVLIEQIYRSQEIFRGSPYHHE